MRCELGRMRPRRSLRAGWRTWLPGRRRGGGSKAPDVAGMRCAGRLDLIDAPVVGDAGLESGDSGSRAGRTDARRPCSRRSAGRPCRGKRRGTRPCRRTSTAAAAPRHRWRRPPARDSGPYRCGTRRCVCRHSRLTTPCSRISRWPGTCRGRRHPIAPPRSGSRGRYSSKVFWSKSIRSLISTHWSKRIVAAPGIAPCQQVMAPVWRLYWVSMDQSS